MAPSLFGRLGLESARIPLTDRRGLLWLERGRLYVEAGTLRFATAGGPHLQAGDYAIPFQELVGIIAEPGVTLTHDALRIAAGHDVGVFVVGEAGVRLYASLPAGPDSSARARRHARLWGDEGARVTTARRMYAWRLGEVLPNASLDVLRGIEGARVKRSYQIAAEKHGIEWRRRRYDRNAPDGDDGPNQALNHAATACYALAGVATAVTGAVPQLGFIHEDSGVSFCLDIADLFRENVTLEVAFGSYAEWLKSRQNEPLERVVRQRAASHFRRYEVIGQMIDRIKELLDADDDRRD